MELSIAIPIKEDDAPLYLPAKLKATNLRLKKELI